MLFDCIVHMARVSADLFMPFRPGDALLPTILRLYLFACVTNKFD